MTNKKGLSMGSTVRLTKIIRDKILRELLDRAFSSEEKQIEKDRELLAAMVYDDLYPAAVKKAMSKLPSDFFEVEVVLRINFGGQISLLKMGKNPVAVRHIKLEYGSAAMSYVAGSPRAMQFVDIENKARAIYENRTKTQKSARAVLESCSTLKQLLQVWPEVEPFVLKYQEAPAACVALTAPIAELNVQLGLNTKKK
jgi:hypothetical protein